MNAHTALTNQCAACAPGHRDEEDTHSLHAQQSQTLTFRQTVFKMQRAPKRKTEMQTLQLFACTFVYLL